MPRNRKRTGRKSGKPIGVEGRHVHMMFSIPEDLAKLIRMLPNASYAVTQAMREYLKDILVVTDERSQYWTRKQWEEVPDDLKEQWLAMHEGRIPEFVD